MISEHSAGAIIFRREEQDLYYLLLKNKFKNEYWDFPRGNIEKGETPEQTTLREVEEETGIKVQLLLKFKERVEWFYRREGNAIHKIVIYFIGKSSTSKVKLSFEHIDYDWLTYEKAHEKLSFKNSKNALDKAHKFLSQSHNLLEFM